MKNNIKYGALQGFYWMIYCTVFGYATMFMTGKGVSAGVIGVIIASAGIIGAVLQPAIGKAVDKGGKFTLHNMISGFLLLMLIAALILQIRSTVALTCLLYIVLMVSTYVMMPLINSASFYMERHGAKVDFGKCRAVGSLAYAVVSVIIGQLVAALDLSAVPGTALVLGIGMMAVINLIPRWKENAVTETPADEISRKDKTERKEVDAEHQNRTGIIQKYPVFMVFVAATALLFTFHNITNLYLFQMMEAAGGNSQDMGISIAIAAVMELPAMIFFSWIIKKWKVETLLTISGIAFLIKGLLFLLAPSVLWIHVAQIFQAASFALFVPASVHFADRSMEQSDKNAGQTMTTAGITLGSVLGSLLGGFVFDAAGIHVMLLMAAGFAAGGAVLLGIAANKARQDV